MMHDHSHRVEHAILVIISSINGTTLLWGYSKLGFSIDTFIETMQYSSLALLYKLLALKLLPLPNKRK